MRNAITKQNDGGQPVSSQFSQRLREGFLLLNVAVAIYLLLALLSYQETDPGWSRTASGVDIANITGKAGAWFADFFLYMFGYMAYLLPFMVGYGAYWLFCQQRSAAPRCYQLLTLKAIGCLLILLAGTGLANIHLTSMQTHVPYTAGGIIGSLVSPFLVNQFNIVGSTMLLITLLLMGVTFISGFSWFKLSKFSMRFGLQSLAKGRVLLRQLLSLCQRLLSRLKQYSLAVRERRQARAVVAAETVKPVKAKKSPRKLKAPKAEQASVIEDVEIISLPVAQPKAKSSRSKRTHSSTANAGLPSLDLLEFYENTSTHRESAEELALKSTEVEEKLKDFGIIVQVVGVHPGPVITRFELELAPGVKVNKLTNLAKDLARSLSTISVRIVEVIPGKTVVGLELPNKSRAIVGLREVFQSRQYDEARSPLSLALGKDIAGHPVIVDLAKMPHLLVAGTTGSGKSVGINAMLMSILFKATAEEVRLILVDPKMLELAVYDGIPHLLAPVVTDMKEAASALRWCVGEMERRYRLMKELRVRNITGFNQKVKDAIKAGEPLIDPLYAAATEGEVAYLEPLPFIVVIIDEFADMMMVVGKKVEQLIARIAQKARAAGIHLILATQRPSVDVITGLIKANVPTRIAYQVSSKIDSRTIIDQQGAEQLLGHGDLLYLPPGSGVPLRVHGAFVDDDEVHRLVEALKEIEPPDYRPDVLTGDSQDDGGEFGMMEGGEEQDELYDQAVEFVTRSRRVSISSVQRRFKIGYNRAARIVEDMERSGVVSSMETTGAREVLAPPPPED